jgi:hypothetical protein
VKPAFFKAGILSYRVGAGALAASDPTRLAGFLASNRFG